jgi:hypothetical protein
LLSNIPCYNMICRLAILQKTVETVNYFPVKI